MNEPATMDEPASMDAPDVVREGAGEVEVLPVEPPVGVVVNPPRQAAAPGQGRAVDVLPAHGRGRVHLLTSRADIRRDRRPAGEYPLQPEGAHRSPATHRRSVRWGKVMVGCLALVMVAPWGFGAARTDSLENRRQEPFPTVTLGGVVDGTVFRQFDRALRDRLTLRTVVVQAVAGGSRELAPTVNVSSKVVLGDDGTPFLAEDFTLPCKDRYDVAATDSVLRGLRNVGRPNGKSFLVAIAPDKSQVLRNRLGSRGDALLACSDRVRRPSERLWAGDPSAPVVTFWRQMDEAARAEPDRVYQPGDSHWTTQGALLFTRGLVDKLVADGVAPPTLGGAVIGTRLPDRVIDGDLYRLMGVQRTDTVPTWVVRRPGVTVTRKVVPSPSGRGMRTNVTTAPPGVALVPGRTLVIYDSFFDRVEPLMTPYFASLTAVHWGDAYTMARNGTLPPFDHLVVESSERGWAERTSWFGQGDPVGRAIAAELGRPSPAVDAGAR